MIAAWMAYALFVGAFAAAAAWVLEQLLRSHRRPARGVWLGGLALSLLWPVWTALRPEPMAIPAGSTPEMGVMSLEPLTLQVGARSIWMLLDRPLVWAWALASGVLLGLAVIVLFRTRSLRRRWEGEEAGGREILISEDWGPAVVGLFRPRIVLPRWCRSMPESELRLILEHEAEHLEAGDLRFLALAAVFPILLPWSLPTWWMWHRLRLAVEGDCDLRVLRRNPRATRAYMELLLEVGRRLPRGRVAAAMLSEPERTLARRIRTMTMPMPKRPFLRGILLVGAGLLLIGVACAVPTPTALDEDAELPAVQAVVAEEAPSLSEGARELMETPTFTPFTVPPRLRNREEMTAALEEEYPPLVRDAGIGGTVTVWFFVDETGTVRNTRLNESSGHQALDEAALRAAARIRFSAALNRDKPVPAWISLPITFSTPPEASPTRRGPGSVPTPPLHDPVDVAETRGRGAGARAPVAPAEAPAAGADLADAPTFTPFTVRPDITNRDVVARAMEAEYPPLLRDAGIGGTATVWFFLDETGTVRRVLLDDSSGHQALDDAAMRVAGQIEFTPALNRDKPVPVWIALPITFTVR